MRKQGFTLIELLVVIAIIAILAAILFPVFARVRLKAQQASCTSNLKQIAMALKMYVSDYAQRMPPNLPDGTAISKRQVYNPLNKATWSQLGPYMGYDNPAKNEMVQCPSAKRPRTIDYYSDYNGQYNPLGWGLSIWSIPESTIADPPNCIVFGDGMTGFRNVQSYLAPIGSPALRSFGLTQDPPYWPGNVYSHSNFVGRHLGKCNFSFADGHVKAMQLEELEKTFLYNGMVWGPANMVAWFYLFPAR